MKVRVALAAFAALVALGTLSGCGPTTTAKVSTTLDVACASTTKAVPVDWYFPVGTPQGLVWLQHGFSESKADWAELAQRFADQGDLVMATSLPSADIYGCTVQNLGNNTGFLNNIASVFAGIGNPSSAIGRSHATAAGKADRSGQALPQRLAFVGHSAGGEAVLYVANRLRTASPTTFAKLGGLVLEDPVKSFVGTNTESSLDGLAPTTLPIYALASPKGSCNSDQSGTQQVIARLPGRFHGALITSGTHGDVFGGSLNGTEKLTCGTPQAKNVAAAQTLTLGWAADQLAGAKNGALYPGGATYQALLTAGTTATLP